jgi:hypothetical protein
LPEHFPAELMRWSRSNDGYQPSHLLAELIVAERRTTSGGGRGVSAFFFDSAEVWELYLWRQLVAVVGCDFPDYCVEWPREKRGAPDFLLRWEGRPVGERIPDLLIQRRDGSKALVVDAKYRTYRPPTDDGNLAVQMFEYVAMAERTGTTPPAVLLYPMCKELNPSPGSSTEQPRHLGRGRFNLPGKPPLTAWGIPLPDLDQKATLANPHAFHTTVRQHLKMILCTELHA